MKNKIEAELDYIEAADKVAKTAFAKLRIELVEMQFPGIQVETTGNMIQLLDGHKIIAKIEIDCGELVLSVPRQEQQRFINTTFFEDALIHTIARHIWRQR